MSDEIDFGNGEVRPAVGDASRLDAFLPTENVQNHAANLLPLPNGDLLCVWFSGTQEGMSDISVYSARLLAGSNAVTPMVLNPNVPRGGDPLGQRGTVGWKASHAAVILNDAWMHRLEIAIPA